MTFKEMMGIFSRRATTIAIAFMISLVLAALAVLATQKRYEVSMLMEVRQSVVGPYAYEIPWIIHREIESGALNGKIALKAGLSKEADQFPRIRSKVLYETEVIRVYAYVPAGRIEPTKKIFKALYDVLEEEYLGLDNPQKQRTLRMLALTDKLRIEKKEIDRRLADSRADMRASGIDRDLNRWIEKFAKVLQEFDKIAGEKGSIYDYSVRMLALPEASAEPIEPRPRQAFLSFGMLGIFAGLAIALWLDERNSAK